MAQSQYPAHAVRAKTNEVVAYHNDESQPGKPLYLLVPGGLIALAALALIILVSYRTWFDGSLDESRAWPILCLLAPAYIAGVAMFSYGYELYDVPKTIRLTLVIVVITLAAVVIVAVLFALVGGGSSKSSSKSSSSSSSSSGAGIGGAIGSFVSGSSASGATLGSSYSTGSGIGPIFLNTGGPAVTHEVTHEVVREVPVSPPPPQPVTCPYCGRSYVPAENKFACPQCGAATRAELWPPAAGTQRESNA